jgi:hypothetical protein
VTIPAWLASPPEATDTVWAWFTAVFIAYLVARKAAVGLRGGQAPTTMARLSDAATFAGSLLVLAGIVHPATMRAVGDTTGFLIMAGVGGFFYGAEQLAGDHGLPG